LTPGQAPGLEIAQRDSHICTPATTTSECFRRSSFTAKSAGEERDDNTV
jgi:hypothetical protein